MATYKFETFNVEIVNPEITISSDNISIFPSNMTIDVTILMKTPDGTKFGYRLTDVPVENLNYDEGTLVTRVMNKLKEFEI